MVFLWLKGIFSRRSGRLLGAIMGVALTVSLLASLGVFIISSESSMTTRAIKDVPVDWQILLAKSSDGPAVQQAVAAATSYTNMETIDYAKIAGLMASKDGTAQQTGPGQIVGISPNYRKVFSSQIRPLLGSLDGVLVAQQTAANLHVTVGDEVKILREGLPPAIVKIDGVVDLPNADSLFQAVGVPTGTAPQAPPDNVLMVPTSLWHQLFDPQAQIRPDSVHTQLHVSIAHNLPTDPSAAFIQAKELAKNVEARIAGSGVVGNNLAARLDGVRADALYARVLFLFLGLPGALLAVFLTLSVAATGGRRRRQEQALLRTRGASIQQVLQLAAIEATVVGLGGVALGFGLTLVAQKIGAVSLHMTNQILIWAVVSALVGLALALVAVLHPAWAETRRTTVVSAKAVIGSNVKPLWQRLYLDVIFLTLAVIVYWQVASTGYQLVLASEGVAKTSVNYSAFVAPLSFWLGSTLLFMRLSSLILARGKLLSVLFQPVVKSLSPMVARSLSRQSQLLIRGMILVALAFSFATSTAVFNTTYNAQARIDAELTNGADVTVSGPTSSPPSSKLAQLKALPGVAAAEPMLHRFAFVGNDLQDLFGINPRTISQATAMSNAYFTNGNAAASLAALAKQPDALLVSDETARDYQLQPGDRLNLRLQSAVDHQYHVIPFHFVGIVRKFPTAPKDSFFVANAAYISQQTGSNAAETVLIRAKDNPTQLANQVRTVVSSLPGAKVSDLGSAQQAISSSLTAIDLQGLTRLELWFAILLAISASGLILVLGLAERKRNFSILTALGANSQQLGAFLWSEGLLVWVGGGLIGTGIGFAMSQILVKLLIGVFDPPPEFLHIPWSYLLTLGLVTAVSTMVALVVAQRISQEQVIKELRNL
ncbi:MAG: ABC transporter permease [Desulfitobacteriaceae bacterium]